MTKLAVLREVHPGERRVAIVPSDVERLASVGLEVSIEAGAGAEAAHSDDEYRKAGATVEADRATLLHDASAAVKVRPPVLDEVGLLPEGVVLVCLLPPATHLDAVGRLRDRRVTTLSFDLVPRISRAQSLDALSSQAGVAGYQAAITAAHRLGRLLPMLMTAAGTIPPARIFVMGAGVAGLQAIATSRRLGGAVSAYDLRPEAAEEVRSLGARFVELPIQARQGSGGYAAEQTHEFLAHQQELIATTVEASDAVITTAAVPGRPAPRLVTTAMVDRMRPGSVIVDLAAASGGNCELTKDGEEIERNGVVVIGAGNLASEVATSASALYSRNVVNLLALLTKDGRIVVDFDDAIVGAMCLTAGGEVRHEPTGSTMQGAAE